MTVVALWGLSVITFVAFWCLLEYYGCWIITFVAHNVCRQLRITFVDYRVCRSIQILQWGMIMFRSTPFLKWWALLPSSPQQLPALASHTPAPSGPCHYKFTCAQFSNILRYLFTNWCIAIGLSRARKLTYSTVADREASIPHFTRMHLLYISIL